jgi:hypothetical protein
MANLIYDLNIGLPVSPHIGGGIGAAQVTQPHEHLWRNTRHGNGFRLTGDGRVEVLDQPGGRRRSRLPLLRHD